MAERIMAERTPFRRALSYSQKVGHLPVTGLFGQIADHPTQLPNKRVLHTTARCIDTSTLLS